MKLVEDWKQAYKWFSMQAAAILALLLWVQANLPSITSNPMLLRITQSPRFTALVGGLPLAIMLLRLIKQAEPSSAPNNTPPAPPVATIPDEPLSK